MSDAPEISLNVELDRAGWGSCRLQVGSESFLIDAISWSTDALGDLVRSALAAAVREWRSACRFDHEPGESRLLAERQWSSGLKPIFRVRVLNFESYHANASDSAGSERFCAECDPDAFARAVLEAVSAVSPERYKKWDQPYPHRVLSALKAALAVEPD